MKQIEINGQLILAIRVPIDGDFYITERLFVFITSKQVVMSTLLPNNNYTILADSNEPERFVKVWYPGAIGDGDTEAEAWQSAASCIMQEHGLEGRVILLTEKTTKP